jgi:tetratricopeptide (TPR) repeat protein
MAPARSAASRRHLSFLRPAVPMDLNLSLSRPPARIILILGVLALCALLAFSIISRFVVSSFNDARIARTMEDLEATARYFPDAPNLQGLLAEAQLASIGRHEASAARAEEAAARAVRLSPWKYDYRLLLSTAREMRGDRAGAEAALKEALRLAPHSVEVNWRLANLLVRTGQLDASLDYFAKAVSASPPLVTPMLNLLWNVGGRNVALLERAAGATTRARLILSFFLLERGEVASATRVFSAIDRGERLSQSEGGAFIAALVEAGQLELARKQWVELTGAASAEALLSNGGFETNPVEGLSQFDWTLAGNKYARVAIDPSTAHGGSRSLRIDFAGVDTTRLEGEIAQLALVKPGARYRLSYYVKTNELSSPEGPRVVALANRTTAVATSEPIANGTRDWQQVSLDLTAPPWASSLLISVRRIPRYSYDDPTRGTLWFDDFTLTEIGGTS